MRMDMQASKRWKAATKQPKAHSYPWVRKVAVTKAIFATSCNVCNFLLSLQKRA